MKAEYLEACFLFDRPLRDLPTKFHIVTAHNPEGQNLDSAANEELDRRLFERLEKLGISSFRATGGSRDMSHREPGYGIKSSERLALAVGREFQQEAIISVDNGIVRLLDCHGKHTAQFVGEPPNLTIRKRLSPRVDFQSA